MIEPTEVLPVLLGQIRVEDGVVTCEEMDVARVKDGQVVAIACDHPSHGTHPRYRQAYVSLNRLLVRYIPLPMPESRCETCQGTRWLKPSSEAAVRMVLIAMTCLLFRGIQVRPKDGFDMTSNRDTLFRFLREQVKE